MALAAAYIALAVILAGAALHVFAERASASSCLPPRPPHEALEHADAVFGGEAVAMRLLLPASRQGGSWSSTDPVLVEFLVSEVWKGQPYETMFVTTRRSSRRGGFDFKVGQRYLVYAQDGEVWLCGRTKHIRAAAEDFEVLDKGTAPAPGTSELRPEFRQDWLWRNLTTNQMYVLAQILAFGLLGALTWFAWRRRA